MLVSEKAYTKYLVHHENRQLAMQKLRVPVSAPQSINTKTLRFGVSIGIMLARYVCCAYTSALTQIVVVWSSLLLRLIATTLCTRLEHCKV
jgi:hypothetical protein